MHGHYVSRDTLRDKRHNCMRIWAGTGDATLETLSIDQGPCDGFASLTSVGRTAVMQGPGSE